MPSGLQPCSSSPISVRELSADNVVLPVPESPKKIAQSPFGPTLAEACIGSTPRAGVKVLDEQLAALEVGEQALVQAGELVGRDRLVDLAPCYRVFGARLLDDVFVPRGAAGEGPGRD